MIIHHRRGDLVTIGLITHGGEQDGTVFSGLLGWVVVLRAVGGGVGGATVAGYGWDECAPPRSMGNPATCQSEK